MDRAVTLIIKNAGVLDGLGSPLRRCDVVVAGDRIAAVADASSGEGSGPGDAVSAAVRVVDGRGRVVCPGFIDVHSHDDAAVCMDPSMLCKTSQGVSTVVVGNCGIGLAPDSQPLARLLTTELSAVLGYRVPARFPAYRDYLQFLADSACAVNRIGLVPHGALRLASMTGPSREATGNEIGRMCSLLGSALEAGAAGLSTGLVYSPGRFASAAELARLCQVLADFDGLYVSHIRDEGARLLESIDEILQLGRATGCRIHVSHLKAIGLDGMDRMQSALAAIHHAAECGVSVTFDVYPYTSGSTALEPALRAANSSVTAPRAVRVISAPRLPHLEGRYLADIAEEWGVGQEQAVARILEQDGSVTAVIEMMAAQTVAAAIASPLAMIGSDGLPNPRGRTHPRLYGTFPRVLHQYAGPGGPLEPAEAVRRMTSFPAQRFGVPDRGVIAPGMRADLLLFNPETVCDRSTDEQPDLLADGIDLVVVNGAVTVERQVPSRALAGELVRRTR